MKEKKSSLPTHVSTQMIASLVKDGHGRNKEIVLHADTMNKSTLHIETMMYQNLHNASKKLLIVISEW